MQPTERLTSRLHLSLVIIGIVFIVLIAAISISPPATVAQTDSVNSPENLDDLSNSTANCRYGVAALSTASTPWVSTFAAGWYLNFQATPPNPYPANGAEFVHMIRVKQNKTAAGAYLSTYTVTPSLTNAGLGSLVSTYPGALWLIGNEPDRGPDPGKTVSVQDDTFPEVYARAYREVYNYIKQRDPSARVGIAGLVQVTPGRLQYLDKVWAGYRSQFGQPMPVDVWNMHIYILPEVNVHGQPNSIANVALGTNPALAKRESGGNAAACPLDEVYCFAEHDNINTFAQQVVAMRNWMKARGQQNKPLILSEYSILYPYDTFPDGSCDFLRDEHGQCFTPARVSAFMQATFNYLNNAKDANLGYPRDDYRLVQQWLWFSTRNNTTGASSNLVNSTYTAPTLMGTTFQNHVNNEPAYVNLLVDRVAYPVAKTNGAASVAVPLSVVFRNNGNARINSAFTVTFYSNAAMTAPIGSPVTVQTGFRGCATVSQTVAVNWPDRTPGLHRYWVKIDSANAVVESNEGDNVGTGVVLVNPNQLFLPLIGR